MVPSSLTPYPLPAITVADGRRRALTNTFVEPAPALHSAALSLSTKPPIITIIAPLPPQSTAGFPIVSRHSWNGVAILPNIDGAVVTHTVSAPRNGSPRRACPLLCLCPWSPVQFLVVFSSLLSPASLCYPPICRTSSSRSPLNFSGWLFWVGTGDRVAQGRRDDWINGLVVATYLCLATETMGRPWTMFGVLLSLLIFIYSWQMAYGTVPKFAGPFSDQKRVINNSLTKIEDNQASVARAEILQNCVKPVCVYGIYHMYIETGM